MATNKYPGHTGFFTIFTATLDGGTVDVQVGLNKILQCQVRATDGSANENFNHLFNLSTKTLTINSSDGASDAEVEITIRGF